MKDIVKSCVTDWNGHKLDDLALFDFEFIFLRIRGLSKGESLTIRFKGIEGSECQLCKKDKTVKVNITDVNVVFDPLHTNKIMLTDDVGMVLKYPSLNIINQYRNYDLNKNLDNIFTVLYACLDNIFTIKSSDVFDRNNITKQEFIEFLEGLTEEQFNKLESFFETMPKLQHTIDLTCPECKRPEFYIMEGLQNFFL